MHKPIYLILIAFILSLNLSAKTQEQYQVNAKNVVTKNEIVTATGDVIIFSKTYFIASDRAIYDKNANTLELFGNVLVLKNNILQSQSDYTFINMSDDSMIQNPTFLLDQSNNLWINSKTSNKQANKVNLEKSTLSSCDCEDPFWSIKFSSGDYDSSSQWINAFNARLYIKDVPVFYTPYFGFSTDKTRRTGLLFPKIGYGSSEGFTYSQALFIAPAANYDIELVPQIRTNRGEGMHAYFRWADSPYSMLKAEAGIFVEQSDYFYEEQLKNKKHFGYSLDYQRSKLFSSNEGHQDGLYVNINRINDLDYPDIQEVRFGDVETRRIESKLNYFYKTPSYYGGLYFRHYDDTSLSNNDTTIQQLPQAQLHQFTKPILFDNLLYSTDVRYTNYTRQQGLNAQQYDVSLPIFYSFSMFDDYVRVTLKEEITLTHLQYDNGTVNFEDGTYLKNRHILEVGTDLLKPYENYVHTLNFNTEFAVPNTVHEKGDLYSINNTTGELAPFAVTEDKKTITFALNQSLYDRDDLKQIVNHKIKQAILYDSFDNTSLGNLENEVTFNYILGSIYNRLIYNHEDNALIESSTGLSLKYKDVAFSASHYMSKDTPNSNKDEVESYMLAASARLARDYWLSYKVHYNMIDDVKSKEAIVFTINDRCWQLDINFENDYETSSTIYGNRSKRQEIVYIALQLKPIGGIMQSFDVGAQ
jgi:LPS-assembly protein